MKIEALADDVIARRHVLRAAWAFSAACAANIAAAATRPADPGRPDRNTGRDPAAGDDGAAHFPFGPVLPMRPIPALSVVTHRGVATDLRAMLAGRVTALQLMFTGCSATCPIQGALFAQAQRLMQGPAPRSEAPTPAPPALPVQWLSLSIDPLADGPAQLAAWLRRFEAGPGWQAAAPRLGDVDRLVALLGSGGESRPRGADPHTGQVYIVDRQGALAFRTPSMPEPARIVATLRRVAAAGSRSQP